MRWDDWRAFLAVARAGTIGAAASEMGVNRTTVYRRLDAARGRPGHAPLRPRRQGATPSRWWVGTGSSTQSAWRRICPAMASPAYRWHTRAPCCELGHGDASSSGPRREARHALLLRGRRSGRARTAPTTAQDDERSALWLLIHADLRRNEGVRLRRLPLPLPGGATASPRGDPCRRRMTGAILCGDASLALVFGCSRRCDFLQRSCLGLFRSRRRRCFSHRGVHHIHPRRRGDWHLRHGRHHLWARS